MNRKTDKRINTFLIITTIIVGMCSIVYELLISTTASYFLGNSIQQFSLIIGIYMASMGVGSWISRWIDRDLMYYFIVVEIILGLVGAFSVPLCYAYFGYSDFSGFSFFTLFIISIIGLLTGLEVPLLTRILENTESLKNNISKVLAFDYLGALIATLLFPFFLVPFLGLFKSSLIFGMINVAIGLITYLIFKPSISPNKNKTIIWIGAISCLLLIGFMLTRAKKIVSDWNDVIYKYNVFYEEETPYQNIILTQNPDEFRLYLNGAIQFSSRDEYRYHEALVHIPLTQLDTVKSVLILGGGEGLAAREVLKYKEVTSVTIVDLDPGVTKISKQIPLLKQLNNDALIDPKVHIINDDAFKFLMENQTRFDAIISDLPDPTSESLARLYSNAFYSLIKKNLSPKGVFVTQATSPELTTNAFWCIKKTMEDSGLKNTFPYHVNVPSFGNWGFIMHTADDRLRTTFRQDIELKYLEAGILSHLLYFPPDKRVNDIKSNNLDQPILLDYYLEHWQSLQGNER